MPVMSVMAAAAQKTRRISDDMESAHFCPLSPGFEQIEIESHAPRRGVLAITCTSGERRFGSPFSGGISANLEGLANLLYERPH